MKDVEKGQYGYIEYRKKVQLIKVLIVLAIIAALLIAGIIIYGTRNNICTVIAIISVLPMAKFLVTLLVVVKHKKPDERCYQELKEAGDKLILLSDCIMSCKDKVVYVDFAIVTDSCIYCYTKDSQFDVAYFEKNVAEFIKSCGDTVNVKLLKDFESFKKRVQSLNHVEYKEKKAERIKNDFLILVI